MKITLVKYNSDWPEAFEKECGVLLKTLGDAVGRIEHIGSTSVPGLVSKPIIDIMIGLVDFSVADRLVPEIVSLGYTYFPKWEMVMPNRRFFKKLVDDTATHHIHMTEINSEFWKRHLLFRNYLRNNPKTADEYAIVKKELAKQDWQDSNDFSDAKTEFIKNIEIKAGKCEERYTLVSKKETAYAVNEEKSRGRTFATDKHPYRSAFERDRDRIIHSQAFRRLEGKTQVFTPGTNDSYRNRLTHSLEVAQIGRTIAKVLGLNESLTEAICLAHDIGHSPFGHTGESVLDKLMAEYGGFEHNRQALRIVDLLEHPYPGFQGLNLMYETRLGLAKHSSPYDKPQTSGFTELQCSLEGQIADLADRIAYNCHDLEDGLRSRLIDENQLKDVELFCQAQEMVGASKMKDLTIRRIRTAKSVIDILVSDTIAASREAIEDANVKTLQDVYDCPGQLIKISDQSDAKLKVLEKFLLDNMYLHSELLEMAKKIEMWLGELFEKIVNDPSIMPGYYQSFIPAEGLERTVCDYISGMTDRYCKLQLH